MRKKVTIVRKRSTSRNWIACLCEALVTSGSMPTWEAATYLTENLFGEKPNLRLLGPVESYSVASQLLHRLYQPIVEAAAREAHVSSSSRLHLFTDISLTGHSAVLVLLFTKQGTRQELIMLDAVKTWDLVFPDADSFNVWAEARYGRMVEALRKHVPDPQETLIPSAV